MFWLTINCLLSDYSCSFLSLLSDTGDCHKINYGLHLIIYLQHYWVVGKNRDFIVSNYMLCIVSCQLHVIYKILSILSLGPFSLSRLLTQIPVCFRQISHSAPFCHRNLHVCAHLSYKMAHCGGHCQHCDHSILAMHKNIFAISIIHLRQGLVYPT